MIMIWYLGNLESLSKSTCWAVLYRMCKLLLEINAHHQIIAWPSQAKAETIIGKFKRRYGMPGIIGAVDGTHIRINAPKEHHCSYINRKNYHSILLQGVCDSDLLFVDIYTGQPRSVHDATLFKKSDLYNRIPTNNIDFLNNTHIIGDKAYPLATYLMVPYKDNGNLTPREKNFNLILSKSRAVIENAYALLKGRFRRLKYIGTVRMEFIVLLVMSATILHNLCILCDDKVEELFSMEKEILEEKQLLL
ncbi:hypothetical protein ILUMI_10362 [Ignelater luminosus]|uniref:DDE Tnp4 domain-containing protein n=1 Tax=Ignelater luminosus TaxID=2038154 RepID=A0A8K0G8S1_IGNLU|nr:hypothetical protein ILUMI_10362 [Ignelater luminosus]